MAIPSDAIVSRQESQWYSSESTRVPSMSQSTAPVMPLFYRDVHSIRASVSNRKVEARSSQSRERLRQQNVDLVETWKLRLRACVRYGKVLSARRRSGTSSLDLRTGALTRIEASTEQNQKNVSRRKIDRHFLNFPAL